MSTIDLNNPPTGLKVTLEPEESRAERNIRLGKDLVLFAMCILSLGAIGWVCLATLLSQTAGSEEKKWAMSILSAIAGGFIGYVVKK